MKNWSEIRKMIESAFDARSAREMLNAWHSFGVVSEDHLEKGRKLIKNEFA